MTDDYQPPMDTLQDVTHQLAEVLRAKLEEMAAWCDTHDRPCMAAEIRETLGRTA